MTRCGAFPHYERTTSASPIRPSVRRSGTSRPLPEAAAVGGRLHRVSSFFVSRNVRDLQSCCGLKSLNIRCVRTPTAAQTRLSGELNALIVPGHPDALAVGRVCGRPELREAFWVFPLANGRCKFCVSLAPRRHQKLFVCPFSSP